MMKKARLLTDVSMPFLSSVPARPEPSPDELMPVVGESMAELVKLLTVFARQDETVLIQGATGSGKTRLARWCHAQSPRRHGPFEVLDLMAVPEDLQMAELFGWRKGAFTGALHDAHGSVTRAEGGTLFLDEIDKLSLRAQAGLLQLIEERAYRPLGSDQRAQANVRFLAGTNADLVAAVAKGQFREDLYHRVHVLPVRIPSLDERKDELVAWADYMLARRHREARADGEAVLSVQARQRLMAATWPGNLRQLDNVVRRAYVLALADHGMLMPLVIEDRHMARALAHEASPSRGQMTQGLRAAAAAFVRAARAAGGIDLDLADAFRGFVLATAIQDIGHDDAWRLVGRANLVRNRNHHKALRRELERVDALLQAVGETPFAHLLDIDE